MATAAEDLRIGNVALGRLGITARLTDWDTEVTPAALALRNNYDDWRKEMLASHPWSFAKKRVALTVAEKATDPVWYWSTAHDIPSDCLRVLMVNDPVYRDQWSVEGATVVHNLGDDINLLYIYDRSMTGLEAPLFKKALALHIAIELAEAGVKTTSVSQELEAKYMTALSKAKSVDGQQGSPKSILESTYSIEMGAEY